MSVASSKTGKSKLRVFMAGIVSWVIREGAQAFLPAQGSTREWRIG